MMHRRLTAFFSAAILIAAALTLIATALVPPVATALALTIRGRALIATALALTARARVLIATTLALTTRAVALAEGGRGS